MEKIRTGEVENLLLVLSKLKKSDDCFRLLTDLCTIKEIKDMAQRLEAARLLSEGKNYNEIVEKMGLSSATISRVNRCLQYGSGGYKLALDCLQGGN